MEKFIDIFGLKKSKKLPNDELYVMLMLQRSEEGATTKVDCDDAAIAVACALDSDKCPAECKEGASDEKDEDTKVKSGDLAVKATANNGKAILANGVSDMDTLTFKTSENVEITRVTLERYGYSTTADVDQVWLENEDGTIISNVAEGLDSKGQAKLTLKKDYRNVDGTLNATIVVKTTPESADGNKTIGFKVIDVVSTAKNLDKGDYSPYTYTVVNYAGSEVILNARTAAKTYNWEAGESYEVAKFKLKAPADTAIEVKSIKLTDAAGNQIDYDDYLKDLKVTVAGKEVKSSWNVNKDDELTINLKDVELTAKENAEFVVSIELSDGFDKMGNDVHFYIAEASDISATDAKTESRVSVITNLETKKYELEKDEDGNITGWYTCTFEGGKVKISSTKLGNIDASADSTDIVISQGEISTSQTIKVSKGTITIDVTNHNNQDKRIVKAIRLEIAGDEYEGYYAEEADKALGTQKFTFPAIDIDKSGKIRILVDTDENAVKDAYASFEMNGLKDFKYEDAKDKTKKADISGSLNISRLTIAPSEADLTNTIASDETEFKLNDNSEEVTIFKGKYTANQSDIYLNEFRLLGSATAWAADEDTGKPIHKMTVYLYLNGEKSSVADAELKAINGDDYDVNAKWRAGDTFTNVLVKAGESVDVELKAQVDAKADPAIAANKFTLYLRGEDENGNTPSGKADKKTSKISVVELGTPEVSTSKVAAKTVLLRGADDAVAEFIVKPSGASKLDIESVSITTADDIDCTNLKLEGINKDFKAAEAANTCEITNFVKSVDNSGLTLRIVLKDEPEEDEYDEEGLYRIDITKLEINGVDANETFNKAYAEGIISFSQSGKNTAETTYKVETVKGYNASTKVKNIRFFNGDGEEFDVDGGNEVLSAGKELTIKNTCQEEQIKTIMYTVSRSGFEETVVIDYATYPDYFKTTGGDKLRVYANDAKVESACTVNNKIGGEEEEEDTEYEVSAVTLKIGEAEAAAMTAGEDNWTLTANEVTYVVTATLTEDEVTAVTLKIGEAEAAAMTAGEDNWTLTANEVTYVVTPTVSEVQE